MHSDEPQQRVCDPYLLNQVFRAPVDGDYLFGIVHEGSVDMERAIHTFDGSVEWERVASYEPGQFIGGEAFIGLPAPIGVTRLRVTSDEALVEFITLEQYIQAPRKYVDSWLKKAIFGAHNARARLEHERGLAHEDELIRASMPPSPDPHDKLDKLVDEVQQMRKMLDEIRKQNEVSAQRQKLSDLSEALEEFMRNADDERKHKARPLPS